jgi:hypothetical protein
MRNGYESSEKKYNYIGFQLRWFQERLFTRGAKAQTSLSLKV